MVSAISTYIYFFLKVQKIKRAEERQSDEGILRRKDLVWDNFKVPVLMVLTYILFNISAQVLSIMASYGIFDAGINSVLYNIAYLVAIPAFSADAFIYLLLHKDVRKKISLKRKKANRVH